MRRALLSPGLRNAGSLHAGSGESDPSEIGGALTSGFLLSKLVWRITRNGYGSQKPHPRQQGKENRGVINAKFIGSMAQMGIKQMGLI